MVILRLGPYVCAEWEFGGYPWWLQNIEGLELRRDNEQFLKYIRQYIDHLYKEVGNLQITKGGPVIMVQAENAKRSMWNINRNPIYSSNGIQSWNFIYIVPVIY
jgi:beta-galactosidase GanA